MTMPTIQHLQGDCLEVLKTVADGSVQLIVTSPPYAEARKGNYDGWGVDKYVGEFLLRSQEFKRVLKPKGTFILNIKEGVVGGVRHRYVRDLIDGLEKQGWLFTEQWIWHKKTCNPGWWPNRFRDAWEHLFQFNLDRRFDMHQDAVKIPVGDWAEQRIPRLSAKDRTRDKSSTGSPFAKNVSNWEGRDMVNPTNVLHLTDEVEEWLFEYTNGKACVDCTNNWPAAALFLIYRDSAEAKETHTLEELQGEAKKCEIVCASCTRIREANNVNVRHLSSETGDKKHSAAFPIALPTFFVKLFSLPEETVLDPFAGSGTTGVAAARFRRSYIGIDKIEANITLAKDRLASDDQATMQLASPTYIEMIEDKKQSQKAKERASEIARLKKKASDDEAMGVTEDGIFKFAFDL